MKKKVFKLLGALWIICFVLCGSNSVYSYAAANRESTETKKVPIDDSVPIATTSKYKDMDYSFLKTIKFGEGKDVNTEFNTVSDMAHANLANGLKVKTKGYYKAGDLGAAVYVIENKLEKGGIKLDNGLYANMMPDEYVDAEGVKWLVVNAMQFGAKGDAKHEEHEAINFGAQRLGNLVNAEGSGYERGLYYLPAGEYKLGYGISIGSSNINFVGDGDESVIVTDNDYRDQEGYSEFLFTCWGTNNSYFGNFRIEAREVDLYHYMRQFVVLYSDNVYVYKVNLIIPQASYNSYYYEDKQYSNFCCYTGNKNVTVDSCKMDQMSGTYRGANIGVLDIWAAGEENITIMNCDLYGNARDEQVGFFSKNDNNASLKNINFLNNTMHSVQLKYIDIIGNRTMCFTVAYADSKNIDGIRIAGNHFISETDSKFMTFGSLTNCKVEDNIIEVKCTYSSSSMLFDSSNGDPANVLIQNNDIFVTTEVGKGRGNVFRGKATLKGNTILLDTQLVYSLGNSEIHDNTIVALDKVGSIGENANITGNKIYLFNELGSIGTDKKQVATYVNAKEDSEFVFSNNLVCDYRRCTCFEGLRSILKLDSNLKSLIMENNEVYFPNTKFITSDYSCPYYWYDENGEKYYKNNVLRTRSGSYGSVIIRNNKLQNVCIPDDSEVIKYINNTEIPYEEDLSEVLASKIEIINKDKEVKSFATTDDVVDLSCVAYIATETDEEGNVTKEEKTEGKQIKWYSSSPRMATVTDDGKVTKNMNGEVHIYAVPLDGSNVYGECVINFEKAASTSINFLDSVKKLEPGLKYYSEFEVLPAGSSQKLDWSSSDENVATVDINGIVTAKNPGTAVITATTRDGSEVTASYRVVVEELTVKRINMENSYVYYENSKIGSTFQLKVGSYYPDNATNKGISKWTSSNEKVATVDKDGKVTLVGQGKCIIYAHSLNDSCQGSTYIFVQPGKVKNIKAAVTTDSIDLSWDPADEVRGYFLYQWDYDKSEWTALNSGNPFDSNGFAIKNLEKDKQYKFAVRSYIHRWEVGGYQEYYYSDYSTIETKTLTYTPVSAVRGYYSPLTLKLGQVTNYDVVYSPDTANYPGLDILVENSDPTNAGIELKSHSGAKYTYEITGLKYGRSTIKFSANDDVKKCLSLPVRVITSSSVAGKDATTIVAESKGVRINFPAVENETELINQDAMTGYMIRRTFTNEFWDYKYIPANGSEKYEFLDTDIAPNCTYKYTVAVCYKEDDIYFNGNSNGKYTVTTLENKAAESVQMQNKVATLNQGSQTDIMAKVGPDDVSLVSLSWISDNSDVASVEHVKTEESKCMDYAKVTANSVGVTKVKAMAIDGSGASDLITIAVIPGKVKNANTLAAGKAELTWDAIENVNGYFVYRYDEKTKTWQKIADVTNNRYKDGTAEVNNTYKYKVSGYVSDENEKYEGASGEEFEIKIAEKAEPETTTKAPETTTKAPETTTKAPETTTKAPETTTKAPETTTKVPETTTKAGETTTKQDETTTKQDETTTKQDETTTQADGQNIEVSGISADYDGKAHPAVVLKNVSATDKVEYSTDSNTWSETMPMVTNVADSKKIKVKITRAGKTYDYIVDAIINPKDISGDNITLNKTELEWNGKVQRPEVVTPAAYTKNDYSVKYSGNGKKLGKYTVTFEAKGNYIGTKNLQYSVNVYKNMVYKVKNYNCKILGKGKVSIKKALKKNKTIVVIPDKISIGGKKFKVTRIESKAFANNKKLKKLTIGSQITEIGSNAFADDKQLKTIVIKSKKINKVGKNAWKNINAKAKFKVPTSRVKKYKKLFTKKTGYLKKNINYISFI